MIKKIGGWGNFSALCILVIILLYSAIQRYNLHRKSVFVLGVSQGLQNGVKGNIRLQYLFKVNSEQFEGEVPESFCQECKKCCEIGDTVIVRYQSGNPKNNDLVARLPDGAILEGN